MRLLYPHIKPNQQLFIQRAEHRLYLEESGNADGIPVLYLHGGPGGGSSEHHRRYFDPQRYRIIVFDQRGAGRSTPHASTVNNTTALLLEDIEEIREHFGIDKWLIAGGSWGTTLGLAYGQAFPHRVLGFILRGIFLGSETELEWLYGANGASRFFPDDYQNFLAPIEFMAGGRVIANYHKLLSSDNDIAKVAAAKAWTLWETRISALHVEQRSIDTPEDTHNAIAMASIENHYFINQCFLQPNELLKKLSSIAHLPAYVIHGRYDMVCQVQAAYQLVDRWPNARLHIIPNAGHSGFEDGIIDAIIQASDMMADFLLESK
ncbi:prolyl aminopeptidase [Thalassotalea ponticola]|uniref:prolyl aminopeptidase n=1 Tax=Thalassotalea ponticola TaxID=1523392 RepID=UPI0025B2D15B|nr:prolyl aminopeptidase [Thalassotalea ponticola]MDN3653723.1 prolyl aminopeptidase [Thalassotalea ponticola]